MYNILKNLKNFKYGEKTYFIWFEDMELKIALSQIPDIKEFLINKTLMTKQEIKEIKRKPFVLNNEVEVFLEDKIKNEIYTFKIEKGYKYDGASIPKIFASIIGSKGDVRFKTASLIHDVLCENHSYVSNDRYFATKVFERCCYVGGTCGIVRFLMFHSVDNYQKFCKWKKDK